MIFAIATDERSLEVFPSEARAIAACEALDVESGNWLFFSHDGAPLEPQFTALSKRGFFAAQNGQYRLVPSDSGNYAHLSEILVEVATFESSPPFHSAGSIEAHLAALKAAVKRGSSSDA